MKEIAQELFDIANDLDEFSSKFEQPSIVEAIANVELAVREVGRSASGSWLGYQSRVYYRGLKPVPAGARFSKQRGASDFAQMLGETRGEWCEYDAESIKESVYELAGQPDLEEAKILLRTSISLFDEKLSEIVSCLIRTEEEGEDKFISLIKEKIEGNTIASLRDFVEAATPSGSFMISDNEALDGGI